MRKYIWLAVLPTLLLTYGCGAGIKGHLVGIQGIKYQQTGLKHTTGHNGRYVYQSGVPVSFYVGDILLGTILPAREITLEALAGGNKTVETNLRRFLGTIDYDLSPMNGVTVVKETHLAARGRSLDFNQPLDTFKMEAEAILGSPLMSDVNDYALKQTLDTLLAARNIATPDSETIKQPFVYPFLSPEEKLELIETTREESGIACQGLAATDSSACPVEQEADNVISLLLQDTAIRGDSPLELIFRAYKADLVTSRDAGPGQGSLVDLYIKYKARVSNNGRTACYVERRILIDGEDDGACAENPSLAGIGGTSVQHLLVMSDFQMHDDESPLNAKPFWSIVPASFYPASASIPYQIDDMVRTVKDYEQAVKAIDMAILTGDLADISQYNEVRWVIDILDGKEINPDSGWDNNPVPYRFDDGKPNDTYDAFKAEGLDIPWYFVPGNHDGLVLGNFPVTDRELNLFGKTIHGGTRKIYDTISTGFVNYIGFDPTLEGFLKHLADPRKLYVWPDADRRVVSYTDIAQQMLISEDDGSQGHGMNIVKNTNGSLEGRKHYSFTHPSGNGSSVIRYVMLDTNTVAYAEGWLRPRDFEWLEDELQNAQAENQLVVVNSHHGPESIISNTYWRKLKPRGRILKNPGCVKKIKRLGTVNDCDALIHTLNKYPNVIAHLHGHDHANKVTPRTNGENGYWQIMTGSMVSWPQQFRVLDIKTEGCTGLIASTMLNHTTANPLDVSQRGRFLAYLNAYLEGYRAQGEKLGIEAALDSREGGNADRNSLLYFRIPPGVAGCY